MLAPLFDELSVEDCERLLERTHVGRLAFALHDAVEVVPLGYHFEKGWIYGRTSPGGKLTTLDRNRRVAFEVDEVNGPLEWKSVIVHGSFYLLDPASGDETRSKLARIFPDAFSGADPVSFRNQFFGISIEEISGRMAKPEAGQPRPVTQGAAASGPDPESDAQVRNAVLGEIAKLSDGRQENIRTGVEDGVVILSGSVSDARLRSDLDDAIAALPGVRGIVQELDVAWPVKVQRTSTEIALEAVAAIRRAMPDGAGHVVAIFENGWIRVEGKVSPADRLRVVASVQHIAGSRGVIDKLKDLS
ncbi:MAG TPA: pyridoxamine 5'-phosphate oxidase family protein, partial [Gemmatimonadaceae bacterium]|nr:pyridoxamine 5'-phosphate oxidase family protein [Gemmatimonadaceae bacterium]